MVGCGSFSICGFTHCDRRSWRVGLSTDLLPGRAVTKDAPMGVHLSNAIAKLEETVTQLNADVSVLAQGRAEIRELVNGLQAKLLLLKLISHRLGVQSERWHGR